MSPEIVDRLIEQALSKGETTLSEYDSKRILAAYGVPIADEQWAEDVSAALDAASQLGYPVAVKACAANLVHKTERGLVRLGLDGPAAVETAIAEMDDARGSAGPGGYLVQRMIEGSREIIVGATRDETFGPCVMLGLGGILVEAVGDVSFRLVPLDERDAIEMIGELHARRMFDAFRGEPPVDRTALSAVLIAAGRILDGHLHISQIDINPLIVTGSAPVAVDALITLEDETAETKETGV